MDTATTPLTPASDAVTFLPHVLSALKVGAIRFAASLHIVNALDPAKLPGLWPLDYVQSLLTDHNIALPSPTPDYDHVGSTHPDPVSQRHVRNRDCALVYHDAGFHPASPSGDPPTSVQPPEINLPASSRETDGGLTLTSDDFPVTFRHSGWARNRVLIRQALARTETSERRLSAFDLCGSDPWVAVDQSDPEHLTILTNHCHSRWCVPCSRDRANRIVTNMTSQLDHGTVRFLTLTLKHSSTPLAEQITRIYHCFRRLRRARFWQAGVTGGCAVLEIKHSHRDDLWHVHIHCLIQGNYIPHRDLKAEWWRITGDSNVIDIRPVTDSRKGARHITKYITKPIASTLINKPDCLDEMIVACDRRRLVLTWGSWRGLALSKSPNDITWKSVCSLADLYKRYDVGDLDAILTVMALEKCIPDARALSGRGPPPDKPWQSRSV